MSAVVEQAVVIPDIDPALVTTYTYRNRLDNGKVS